MADESGPTGQMTPEQARELQEKIKNMSPEELREFQKQQCIFCHIISGKVQSKKIYEDDKVLAVLDINPANPGHILLLPKEHYAILPQLSDEEIGYIFQVAKALSHAVLKSLQCHGTNIFVANGIAAGQKAQHFMVHIIPRMENDKVGIDLPEGKITDQQLDQIHKVLAEKLGAGKRPAPGVVEAEFREEKKAVKAEPEEEETEAEEKGEEEAAAEDEGEESEEPEEEAEEQEEEKPSMKADEDDILELLGDRQAAVKKEKKPAAKPKTKKTRSKKAAGKKEEEQAEPEDTGKEADLDEISRLFGA